jgi:predicted RecB family nuclease
VQNIRLIMAQRICKNGHRYFKTSDCPTCPICEAERKPKDIFLAKLAAPARRALENKGIGTLEQLAQFSETEILNLHGMGKRSIEQLNQFLIDNNFSFKKHQVFDTNTYV